MNNGTMKRLKISYLMQLTGRERDSIGGDFFGCCLLNNYCLIINIIIINTITDSFRFLRIGNDALGNLKRDRGE